MSGVGSFCGQEVLSFFLVFIGVSEVDLSEGASSSGVMEDGSHDTSDVSIALGEVEVTISGGCDSLALGSGVHVSLFTFSLA